MAHPQQERTVNAREALEKAIAAAERAQHSMDTNVGKSLDVDSSLVIAAMSGAYAEQAQAWAAIAVELRWHAWDQGMSVAERRDHSAFMDEGGDGGDHEPSHQEHRWEDRR